MWTRRDLLRAAGLGAGVAWLGCRSSTAPAIARPEVGPDELRAALRAAVEIAGARLQAPVAYARVRRRMVALVDLIERDVDDQLTTVVVIAGRDHAGRWRERALDRSDPSLILAAARALVADAPPGPATPIALGAAEDRAAAPAVDPARLTVSDWRARADDLAVRADAGATSRIVYRAVHLRTDDERTWVVTDTRDRSERLVRSRIGATAIAWHGNAPVAGAVEVIGGFGPEPDRITAEQLAAVNAEALALTTPGGFAPVEADVVLAPQVMAALLAVVGVGHSEGWTATEVPDLSHDGVPAYASYALGALGGDPSVRRGGRYARLSRRPSNLVVAPGVSDDLLADVDDGYLLDGVAHGSHGDRGPSVRVGRVRRVARGRRTGHAWRDVELSSSVATLLSGISAVGATAIAIAPDDDDPPLAVITPAVRTRAELRGAR